jgi:hypothetical protein
MVQKDQGKKVKLTEGCGGRSCGGRWPAARSCGGDGSVLAGRGVAEALRATGHRGSMRGDPVKVPAGLGRFGDRRRRRIAGRSGSPAAASSRIPGDAGARGTNAGLGQLLDSKRERTRGLRRPEARWSGLTTARPR